MAKMKSDVGGGVKKKRGPKPGTKEAPRKGLAALMMKKGRKSEKSTKPTGLQKFF